MSYDYHKLQYRSEEGKEGNPCRVEGERVEGRMYYGGRKDLEEGHKEAPLHPKPSDVRNTDLVSLLLAATPPYLYNMPLVPQTFFFSEMLRSFVQAKAERQSLKAHQGHHRRQRKRTWRELSPPKPTMDPTDKPLELTTNRQPQEDKTRPPAKKHQPEVTEKKLPSCDFTAEKLANSSISSTNPPDAGNFGGDVLPLNPSLWYPPLYPTHPPYGIDPFHFFIDLRVSAQIWDRKLAAEGRIDETSLPLDLHSEKGPQERSQTTTVQEPGLTKNRHHSAFSVPGERTGEERAFRKSEQSVHYVMTNLKRIYKGKEGEKEGKEEGEKEGEEGREGKKCKDLRALIGLELVVDYVKQESDVESEGEGEGKEDGDEGKEGETV